MRSHDHHKHDQHSEYNHSPTHIFQHYECSVYIPTHTCIPVTICHAINDNDMHSYQKFK